MPPCPSRGGGRRGGTSFGTSSSSRGDTDSTLRTALLSGLKLFGEKYDFELLAKRDECERLVRLYKQCKIDRLSNCDFYLGLRSEGCPDFNKEEFLQTLRVSNPKGTSFGTSSSSRRDYDWFETAVISFFKLFSEKYDYELLTKRKECERLVGLYKEKSFRRLYECLIRRVMERLLGLLQVPGGIMCKTNKLSHCDVYLEQRPEGCPDFNKVWLMEKLKVVDSCPAYSARGFFFRQRLVDFPNEGWWCHWMCNRSAVDIAWRCPWFDLPEMCYSMSRQPGIQLVGLTHYVFYFRFRFRRRFGHNQTCPEKRVEYPASFPVRGSQLARYPTAWRTKEPLAPAPNFSCALSGECIAWLEDEAQTGPTLASEASTSSGK
ncbi:uncharacterized protein LOC114288484 isoform X3 [Camellia sinensis]|uniref:uncharacterized protein LOC114288484 isoform X3 n=1 Tax=Camellia sinensis TaxID=4442 RepID=UPI001036BA3C|nr:uncharacterized protein LOC114288484 isoform X3 [Camellia sinensis]